jgi:nitrogen fixation protein FixH
VVAATSVEVALGRPAHEAEDTTVALSPTGDGSFGGDIALADGQWIVRLSAEAGLAQPWLDIRRIHVRDGAMQ